MTQCSYDSAVDVWSVGCIFAEILLRKPLLQGKNYKDQLKMIVTFLVSTIHNDTYTNIYIYIFILSFEDLSS